MNCLACGNKDNPENARFCTGCGQSLSEPTDTTVGTDKKQKKGHLFRNMVLITVAIFVALIVLAEMSSDSTPEIPPHEETPPPELIKFTVSEYGSIVVDDFATKVEIYELGLWLLRYPNLHVMYWIVGEETGEKAWVTRGDGSKLSAGFIQRDNFHNCKGDDQGYVVWYLWTELGGLELESISTDGVSEIYNSAMTEPYYDEGKLYHPMYRIEDRCTYWGLKDHPDNT